MVDITDKSGRTAFLALIIGAICIALSPIFVRLSELDPNATAFYRVFLCLPPLFLWGIIDGGTGGGHNRPHTSGDVLLLLLPGVFFAGDLGFWHWSIKYTTVANATLFANFAPVYVTLASYLLFKERFNRIFLAALVISTIGSFILMGTSVSLGDDLFRGDVLGMIAAVFYAAYLVVVGRLRSRFSTLTIMFWSCLSASLILFPVSLISGDTLMPASTGGWGILLALAWISHLGGQGLIAWALAHLSAALSSVSLLVQPVCAALFAWVLFSESLGPLQITGGITVLFGIYLARRASFMAINIDEK